MTYTATFGVMKSVRSKTPAAREPKRPNGHKAQLALKREIEKLHSHIDRQDKAISTAQQRHFELENRLLAVSADRDGWRAAAERYAKLVAEVERRLGLSGVGRSWNERCEQLLAVLADQESVAG